jgi:glycerol dehydrogenase
VTRVFGAPGTYVQGRDVLDTVADHVDTSGDRAVVLADPEVVDVAADPLRAALCGTGLAVDTATLRDGCTRAEIDRVTAVAEGADLVVGAGGGRTLDTAKAVRAAVDARLVTVPTVASTDAPTSSLSVVYTDDGAFEEFRFHDDHPDLVLVDTGVVAAAPVRFFRSGIADALATWFEADTAARAHAGNVFDGQSTRTAHAIARECYETVREHGPGAVAAVERDAVTEDVEAVVEANTLMSGVGFESGGLAAAHSVHDGLTRVEATHGATHGEKVNVGTLTQLVLEGRDTDAVREFLDLSLALDLPVTLADVGLDDPSDAELRTVAEAACESHETIHNEPFDVAPEAVRDALVTADRLARDRRARRRD